MTGENGSFPGKENLKKLRRQFDKPGGKKVPTNLPYSKVSEILSRPINPPILKPPRG
jgi:hypothetical protein